MGSRLELQYILESLIENTNVHYNAPDNDDMSYPAIIYSPCEIDTKYANDMLYLSKTRYLITVIGEFPNDNIVKKILNLPMCSFDRHYTYDGLNHDVLKLYY